jgi:hypothetical protein
VEGMAAGGRKQTQDKLQMDLSVIVVFMLHVF